MFPQDAISFDVVVTDLDADGVLDILSPTTPYFDDVGGGIGQDVQWLRGLGAGNFIRAGHFRVGPEPAAVEVVEVDGRGLPDIVAGTQDGIALPFNRFGPVSHDRNGDGLPDICEGVRTFRRGDADIDGVLRVSDAVAVLRIAFGAAARVACAEATDATNDGAINVADAVHILRWLFADGPSPAALGPSCGPDPDPLGTWDDLGCAEYPACR